MLANDIASWAYGIFQKYLPRDWPDVNLNCQVYHISLSWWRATFRQS